LADREQPKLIFNNFTTLTPVQDHKHLGVILSKDGTWHEHITNINSSASKVLGSMKMLKFKLKRTTLNQIYISYLRPILEYASVLWDSCTNVEKETLEKMQYEAARIVTGLTRSVSIDKLLKEIAWVSLSDRRKIQKLVLVYKEKHGFLPTYISELFPPMVNENNHYDLRNNSNYLTVQRRTEIYSRSVIPSCVKLWNELSQTIRDAPNLSNFKNLMKNHFKFFLSGDRTSSVHHARIRNQCSNLNADLFRNYQRHR
jgi:hypothetical protein